MNDARALRRAARHLERLPAPHLLVAALCLGIALALVGRTSAGVLVLEAAAFSLLGLIAGRRRAAFLAAALALAGLWWGSARLEALDSSQPEAEILGHQGVEVVLRGSSFRVVGRRGGLGGVADRLRRAVSRSLEAVPPGERRAVLAGVVLGEDEGLGDELREHFRSSGLYHLLSVDRPGSAAAVLERTRASGAG